MLKGPPKGCSGGGTSLLVHYITKYGRFGVEGNPGTMDIWGPVWVLWGVLQPHIVVLAFLVDLNLRGHAHRILLEKLCRASGRASDFRFLGVPLPTSEITR